jgi:hypothetical protein
MIDFQRAKITSDSGFLLLRNIDDRFGVFVLLGSELEDIRSWVHSKTLSFKWPAGGCIR